MQTPNPHNDTIVALATAPGKSAISVVRMSGANVIDIGNKVLGSIPEPRYASLRTLKTLDGIGFDQAIALYFPAPHSFTGESMLEIQTHGGRVVTEQLIGVCLSSGARLARAGEFSERAFLNGKMDLLQAEAISDLISSGSVRAARSAFNSLDGMFSDSVNDISDKIRILRTELEAYIDFPEEDIPPDLLLDLKQRLLAIKERLQDLLSSARQGARLNRGSDIAIIGQPNVGKSTLLNALAREDKAITSNIPGTTRDVLSVDIEFDGYQYRFHDTAGLRTKPSDDIEKEGIRRTKKLVEKVDVCLVVHDGSQYTSTTKLEHDNIDYLGFSEEAKTIHVVNKIDLLASEMSADDEKNSKTCYISAKTHQGLSELLSTIQNQIGLETQDESTFIARERHIYNLEECLAFLELDLSSEIDDLELLAEKMRLAQKALGSIVGEFTNEDLLGDIFSTFCIGK